MAEDPDHAPTWQLVLLALVAAVILLGVWCAYHAAFGYRP